MKIFSVKGHLVDVHKEKIYPAEVFLENGKIISIEELTDNPQLTAHNYILPGFIDSHVHIESSMLVPSEFARLAVVHGTVATVSDPHEIANVCGLAGVEFMIENGKTVPFKFNFGAPSCVPATIFETAGAELNANDVEKLLQRDEIKYLSEMMNFPGVLNEDPEVMKKIAAAHRLNKPVDGHAPGLRGDDARRYIHTLVNPSQGEACPNPSKGGALESDNSIGHYSYHTADPHVYGLLKKFVKEHRENPTHAENVLWHLLRGKKLNGYKFRRQHIIGSYIADFVCLNKKLVIEVDGLIHQLPENKISDKERTFSLNQLGFRVLRFTNEEISNVPDKVLSAILLELNKTTIVKSESEIPPLGGGGAVISTDHECFTKEEALDKLKYGMKILIREGSAAKNFEALIDLLNDYPDMIMFCSDDKHPDSLVEGHINQLCERAVAKGIDVFKIIKAACINPVLHYKLDVGLLREGDDADFIIVKNLQTFEVLQTYINGELVAENGKSKIITNKSRAINNFCCTKKSVADFGTPLKTHNPIAIGSQPATVIEAVDGQLITNKIAANLPTVNGQLTTDIENDILKIAVVNRYKEAPISTAFIKNFGLKRGALASSVAHDSHNIVAVGTDDESICKAVNMVIKNKGGISCVKDNLELIVPLPVAGLMSSEDGYKVAQQYSLIDKAAKEAGSTLSSPFMTLSFMALLVIPHLKLSDLGLFDGNRFEFIH